MNNFPVKVEYVTNKHTILGPDLEGVRVKTVRPKLDMVDAELIPIPRDLSYLQKFLTLTADVMFFSCI